MRLQRNCKLKLEKQNVCCEIHQENHKEPFVQKGISNIQAILLRF